MGKTKDLGHLAHIVAYDAENHITVPAGITMHTNQLVASQSWVTTELGSYALSTSLGSYVPTSRTITINGTVYDLSENREWNITSMIYPAAGIPLSTGSAWGTSITNNSANWNTAYGWGNHASAGYLTGITSTQVTTALGFTPVTNARTITINGTTWDLSANRSFTVTATETDTLATVTARGATTSTQTIFTSTSSDYSIIARNDGSGTSWRGRIGHFNATADKSVWFATYNGFAVVGAHNNALTAWADLLVNCVNNNGDGGTTRLSTSSFVGSNAIIHAGNIGSQSVSYASSAGNADTVDGYHVSTGGTANTIPTRNASGYLSPENWIQVNGHYGLYSGTNNAHFYPNNSSYGAWKILGERNGWRGIHFGEGTGMTLMMNETEFGFHREGYGWYARFTNGHFHGYSNSAGTADNLSGFDKTNPSFGAVYASGNIEAGPNSGGDKGIGILYGTGEYGRIRFYQDGRNNHSTIHSFGSGWQSGNVNTSGGAINIDGQLGVTIGAWNAPTMVIAKSGTVTINAYVATTGETYTGLWFKSGYGSDQPYLWNSYGTDHWRAAGSAWFTYTAVGSTNFFSTSRRAVKTQIQSFNRSAVELINTVDIVEYRYKNDLNNKRIGFIAEDTIAEIATESHDQMDINSSIGLLLKAVQELSSENKQIRIELNQLKTT